LKIVYVQEISFVKYLLIFIRLLFVFVSERKIK